MTSAEAPFPLARRGGTYVRQPTGYRAFIPKPLPPDPPLNMDAELLNRLSAADQALGRLDGTATLLPDPDRFVYTYIRKEAVLSSQIEGTQASLVDVLEYEASAPPRRPLGDAAEVVNYVVAMNYGLERLRDLPLSLRLIREIHARLLEGVRGSEWTPGEFRRSQNWVGAPGGLLADAAYIPPPVHEMNKALGDLELFLHDETPVPPLVKCALVHSQFETIHPFLDGNGRMGRLLMTFLLCQQGILSKPLLYLSYHFKRRRADYYERLQAVRDEGDWEGWVRFFLQGVAEVSAQATDTARRILALHEQHRGLIQARMRTANALRLLELLLKHPVISITEAASSLELTYGGVKRLMSELGKLGLLTEITGSERFRLYAYEPYLAILSEGTEPESSASPGAR
jgi:Fic family protein